MHSFEVLLDPPLPPPTEGRKRLDFLSLDFGEVTKSIEQQFNLTYNIGNQSIMNYPSNVMVVLGDLVYEATQLEARKSHALEITSYQLAFAHIEGSTVSFFDLHSDPDTGAMKQIGPTLDIAEVLASIYCAINSLLEFIEDNLVCGGARFE
jgi:hypothetical protein